MSQFIDRRISGKNKSAVNRQRFIQRFKQQIKKSVADAIAKRSIANIESGEKITIPNKDISEPVAQHASGGVRHLVHPGNKEFAQGDRIKRPPPSSNNGSNPEASNEGEGEDSFSFELSKEEFMEIYFEDLELPDLIKKSLHNTETFKSVHAGYSKEGNPSNINILRTMKSSLGRRIALGAADKKRIQELEEKIRTLSCTPSTNREQIAELEKKIASLKAKISSIPFIDALDVRYHHRTQQLHPSTQAVMFCIMDVSGSMDEVKKEIAKRFFILLYLFLSKNYKKIEIVFIRHHTSAKEVSEEEFFYSRETGGTVVSSALELTDQIITERYPTAEWNIYAAQATDGDNWNADSPHCQEILQNNIIPKLQYFSYIEIMPRYHQSLWQAYLNIKDSCPNFAMQHINDFSDIYPVFRELFKRSTI